MATDILVIGESLIDIVRRPDEAPQYLPGGSPMNTAIGLGRLGQAPLLATWYGDDDFGRLIERHCAESDVALLPGSNGAVRTPTAEAVIDSSGRAQYTFDLDWQLPPIPASLRPRLVHTGSIGAEREPGGWDVLAYVESIRSSALVTFDPNCRPPVIGTPDSVRPMVERYVAAADLVKVSDEDLAWLYGDAGRVKSKLVCSSETKEVVDERSEEYPGAISQDRAVDLAAQWLALGPAVVVVTLGGAGSVALTSGVGTITLPADTSHGLVDTVGAGDSFMAGLIHGVMSQMGLGRAGVSVSGGSADSLAPSIQSVRSGLGQDRTRLTAVLAQAARIAGITVSRPGADPPRLAELD